LLPWGVRSILQLGSIIWKEYCLPAGNMWEIE